MKTKYIIAAIILAAVSSIAWWPFSTPKERIDLINQWGKSGGEPGEFNEPMGIAVDTDGNVFVADARNSRVQKFTDDGKFILQWGTRGDKDGEFGKPVGVAVDG
ncbi:MAG: hypothetical protein V3S46_03400, partial [Nitrospinota bacterium]